MAEEQTPALVAEKATIPNAVDPRNLIVIGLMQAQDGPAALLRSGRGQVARVTQGSEVFGITITAIGSDVVVMTDARGTTYQLTVATR
ncbi:hypothetical protein [Yoonia sediminilitoris]|uniref:Uncharacterized protein n=1 Tax=Yoonia sediminilitoris TaxID=1286148 RepID=A0A2T6KDZ0_9RHOB|nr:hypothetical protein [Yoonia sediminilitoris]PUB13254.1 hypothetical protein C8N45_108176 [Yoonia sediminilitoris]RCW94589.1 hypothetical protein DFP92_108177 [Yoonia sediminilitoris]